MKKRMTNKSHRHAMHGIGGMGEFIHSDHDAFFAGSEMGASKLTEIYTKYIRPVTDPLVEKNKQKVIEKGTEIINKQLQNDPAMKAKTENTIAETIKGAILQNKWYIIGGLVGLGTFFVVLNRLSSKK